MAKRIVAQGWSRLLRWLGLRGKPLSEPELPALAPSAVRFLCFLPEDPRRAQVSTAEALEFLFEQGQQAGSREQNWVLDQLLRRLTGERYEDFLDAYAVEEEFGIDLHWDRGVEPRARSSSSI